MNPSQGADSWGTIVAAALEGLLESVVTSSLYPSLLFVISRLDSFSDLLGVGLRRVAGDCKTSILLCDVATTRVEP